MSLIYTQGDSNMKLKDAGLKFPEKNILNRKSHFMSAAYPTRYRSQNNKLAGTDNLKWRIMSIYFSPFQLITIKESFLKGSAKTPSVVILDFSTLSSNN